MFYSALWESERPADREQVAFQARSEERLTLCGRRVTHKSMATVLQLPVRRNQTAFNLRRWNELVRDPYYARIEGRCETDRHGNVIMSPPASQSHGGTQFDIGKLLSELLRNGRVLTECPISTVDGVRAADVAWMSAKCVKINAGLVCLRVAPDICVEVFSPSNTRVQMKEKSDLYFSAGAKEVWWCDGKGKMRFFSATDREIATSKLCPEFPKTLARR
jgi:Uma2 family endonuclease